MSILNALAAYGVQQKQSNEATKSNSSQSTDATAKTSASSITEATVYTETKEVKSEQTSDVYSKNGVEQEQVVQDKVPKVEGTEAEQNQARLSNVSSRMTEEDMAMLQKEGFPVGEMTVEQLEAAMERIKLQKELNQGVTGQTSIPVTGYASSQPSVPATGYAPSQQSVPATGYVPSQQSVPTVEYVTGRQQVSGRIDYSTEPIQSSYNTVHTQQSQVATTVQEHSVSIEQMAERQVEVAVERSQVQKELQQGAIEHQVEQIQSDREIIIQQAIKMLAGNPKAEKIAEKLMKANIPVTKANLEKVAIAIEKVPTGVKLSPIECEYMVRNKLTPTLENVATAKTMAQTYSRKEHPLTQEAWEQLEPKVTYLLFQAGLRASTDMINAAQTFIKKDIPLTVENLKSYSLLAGIKLSEDDLLTKAVDAISVGQDPKNTNLLSTTAREVRQILRKTGEVTGKAVDYAAARKSMEQPGVSGDKIELSLADLHEAQELVNNNGKSVDNYLRDLADSGPAQAAAIRARRQLEEIRAQMTYEAGYRLAKEGIRIDTVSMDKLLDNLRTLEARFFSSFFTQAGVAASAEGMELLKDTSRKLDELKNMPATLIVDTMNVGNQITLDELHQTGVSNMTLRRYQENYETVMTSPNKSVGDSIHKAFANSDHLLQNIGLPLNHENRRAVRMLGYSSVEVTRENVEKVRDYDAQLQHVLKELHPAVTVRMIRDGINPLEQSIESLTTKIAEIKEQEGITTEDNYSIFLINLEKKKEITPEERKAYMDVYRTLHQIGGSEEEAIGSVYRNGQELTLQNLLTAIRSGKAQGINTLINDAFGAAAKTPHGQGVTNQQLTEGLMAKAGKNAEVLNKLAEQVDNTISELSNDTSEVAKEQLETVRGLASTGQNATRFLEDYSILTTVENIEAAKNLLANDMTIFKDWKRFKLMDSGEEPILPDFTEFMEDKETMQKAYQSFMNESKEMKSRLVRDPIMTKQDSKAIKKMEVGVRFMNRLSKREFYQIPVDTGKDIVNMNVTIMTKGEERAKLLVDIPTENLGKISCEATIENNKMKCFITSDTREGTQALKDRQLNLTAILSQNRIQIGSLYYGTEEAVQSTYAYQTDGMYKGVEEGEDTGSDNNKLYRIARSLVVHVRNADEDVMYA